MLFEAYKDIFHYTAVRRFFWKPLVSVFAFPDSTKRLHCLSPQLFQFYFQVICCNNCCSFFNEKKLSKMRHCLRTNSNFFLRLKPEMWPLWQFKAFLLCLIYFCISFCTRLLEIGVSGIRKEIRLANRAKWLLAENFLIELNLSSNSLRFGLLMCYFSQ